LRLLPALVNAAAMSAALLPDLDHVDTWIFDLDLTLYAPEHNIMEQVRDRIALYVEDRFKVDAKRAHEIRYNYWRSHGTTLGGLMAEHGVDPHGYLDFVHDVDMSLLQPCAQLRAGIEALPGRKLIFTNADAPYAGRVLTARGLDGLFEDVFDIHQMEHRPKPDLRSYHSLCERHAIDPARAIFFEDSVHNLQPAKTLGMTTAWINHSDDHEGSGECPEFVDHEISDLANWLGILKERELA
jgi:putative hydrolase of the HAD superfamily